MKASYKQEPGALAMNITTLYCCDLLKGTTVLWERVTHSYDPPFISSWHTHTHTHVTNTLFLTFRLSLPYLNKKMSQEIGTLAYG